MCHLLRENVKRHKNVQSADKNSRDSTPQTNRSESIHSDAIVFVNDTIAEIVLQSATVMDQMIFSDAARTRGK